MSIWPPQREYTGDEARYALDLLRYSAGLAEGVRSVASYHVPRERVPVIEAEMRALRDRLEGVEDLPPAFRLYAPPATRALVARLEPGELFDELTEALQDADVGDVTTLHWLAVLIAEWLERQPERWERDIRGAPPGP